MEDWEKLADQNIDEESTPMIAMPGEPTPAGMIRIPWRAYYDEESPFEPEG